MWHASSSSGGTHAQHTQAAAHAALGRHVKDGHVKDVAQDVAEDVAKAVPQGVAQDLAFGGPGGARPPRHATTTAAAVFAQLAAR